MKALLRVAGLLGLFVSTARGNFIPAFMNDGYWFDGKAEFNIYEGTIARYGSPQPAEVIHVLVHEDFAPEAMVKADQWDRPGTYPVLKFNQVLRVRTGVYVYQQMHSSFWTAENARLIKWSLTSSDSCGNTYKVATRPKSGSDTWTYRFDTYWEGQVSGTLEVPSPPGGIFYDELPVRVRSIDFTQPTNAFTVPLAPTAISAKRGEFPFAPAKISYHKEGAAIVVEVEHAKGRDTFLLDPVYPHRLREWRAYDGGVLKLKRSLKLPYWEYHHPGDLERALADPALQLP
ncbi:hypothetical protein AYO41_00455 [Verrucomicrobia bacterium SCGC AG-212-E04]|nr:hypothetical protein AYO41_00455 [Verrucomicrobia bacterium SCGC AG-212-E04]